MNGALATSLAGTGAALAASRASAVYESQAASLSCGGYSAVPDAFLPGSSIEVPRTSMGQLGTRAGRFSERAESFRLAGPADGGSSSPGGVDAPPPPAGGGDGGSGDGKLRSEIRAALESLVAEEDFFEGLSGDELSEKLEELMGVALRKHEFIEAMGHRTTPEHAAGAAIAATKSEARDADYDRYCRAVEEGRISDSIIPPATHGGPVERHRFASRCERNALGIYRKFRRINTLGMWPGRRVSFIDGTDDRVYRVVAISANCCVAVKREGGSKWRGGLSPFRIAPVK